MRNNKTQIKESVKDLLSKITNEDIIKKAETFAKIMNDNGANSKITLDDDKNPFYILTLTCEYLIDAYIQGSGEYQLPNINKSFTINKENIINSFKVLFDPASKNFPTFTKLKKDMAQSPMYVEMIRNILNKSIKRSDVIQRYEEMTGKKLEDGENLPKLKYYITKYIDIGYYPGGYTFLSFIRNLFIITIKTMFKKLAKAKKNVSINDKFGDKTREDFIVQNKETHTNKTVLALRKLLMQKLSKHIQNKTARTYFELMNSIINEHDNLKSSIARNKEVMQQYNTGRMDKKFSQFIDELVSRYKDVYSNAEEVFKIQSKGIKRKARSELLNNIDNILYDLQDSGLTINKEWLLVLIEDVVGTPSKMKKLLDVALKHSENLEFNVNKQTNYKTPEEKENAEEERPQFTSIDDIENNIEHSHNNELYEQSDSEDLEEFPMSFGDLFSLALRKSSDKNTIQEIRKQIKNILSELFLKNLL